MIIQEFAFGGMNVVAGNQKDSSKRSSENTKSDFTKALETQTKDIQNRQSNKDYIKTKVDNKSLINREVSSNIRKINKETKGDTKEKSLESNVEVESKKEKVIEELMQNLNSIILLLQNIEGLEGLNLQEIDLKLSVNDLTALKDALQKISTELNFDEEKVKLQKVSENIENIANTANKEGSVEVDFEDLVNDFKTISDVMETELKINPEFNKNKKLSNQISELKNLIDKQVEEFSKVQTNIDTKAKIKVTIENIEVDIQDVVGENVDIFKEVNMKLNKNNEGNELIEENTVENELNNIVLAEQITQQNVNGGNTKVEKGTSELLQNFNIDKVDVMKQITSKVKADYNDKINEIKVKLSPEHLGNLTIKVTLERGIVAARALVENLHVKNMLESNLNTLKENLKEQGIDLENIDVSVGQDSENQEGHSQKFTRNKRARVSKQSVREIRTDEYDDVDIQNQDMQAGEGSLDIII